TGGAINFLTAKPTKDFEAYLNLDYGRWNTLKLEGAVSGPLGDKLIGRLAFQSVMSDGYYKNNGTTVATGVLGLRASALDSLGFSLGMPPAGEVIPVNPLVPPDDDFLEQDLYSLRGTLAWESGDLVEITTSVHYTEDASDMFVRSLGPDGFDLNGFSPADNNPFTVDANFGAGGSKVDIEGIGGFVKVEIDLERGNLVSVTGYEAIERTIPFEESSPYRILDQLFNDDLYEWSQELRFQVEQDRFLWMVGAYLGKEKISSRKDINSLDSLLRTTVATEFEQEGTNHAVFLHSEWQLNETIGLTAGLRYSHDSKHYSGGSFIPVAPFGPYGVDLAPFILGIPLFSEDSFEEDDVSGKIGVDWNPSEDLLFYLTWNKGYKSGGYDGSTITSVASFEPFFGESVYAWETGLKSATSGHAVRWNISYFNYDYEDMQAEAQRKIPVQGAFESIRANVGEGRIWGLESDLWLIPASGLNVRFGISYVNTKITDWHVDGLASSDPEVVAEAIADFQAHIGNEIPDAPQLTFNGLISYTWHVTSLLSSKIVVDFNYTDEVYKNIDNDEHLKAESYWLLNARVTLAPKHERWEASLWVKNLNNELYYRERFDNFGPSWIYETPGAPRSFGATVAFHWR
ncbi:MAG: iron complex outermembrane receptor protein, partial [Candidatus Azotimanducaceae bacterium]